MTKTTDKRPRVLDHLTTATQVLDFAARYRALQECIVNAKVESLLIGRSLIVGEGQGIHAFGSGLSALDEMTNDFTDAAFDEMWGLHAF